ncbi:MAG: MBL fold metallo-hydrolase [Clostridia bacterium]|nr:MBL fold metallo-hydrolase [Clostridia bacterium]
MIKLQKEKHFTSKKTTTNVFVAIVFVVFFLFVLANQANIQFYANGFGKIWTQPLQVYYLDVGQANASLVILPNKTAMLIDTGSGESEEDFISSVDYILSKNKISKIKYLVLSHSDEDHIGGTEALLDKYQVDNIYRPKQLAKNEESEHDFNRVDTLVYERVTNAISSEPNCTVQFVKNHTIFIDDLTEICFYAPDFDKYSQTNDYSPFVSITYAEKTFLFTGDATTNRERELLERLSDENKTLKVDFLLVAHHGSNTSTSAEFLQAISPTYAFVSAQNKSYPHEEVLNRLKEAGVSKLFNTKTVGMIVVAVQENGNFYIKTLAYHFEIEFFSVAIFLLVCMFVELNSKKNQSKFSVLAKK